MSDYNNINVKYIDLPCSVRSYVVANDDMTYTIVLNSRLSYQQNALSYAHECRHISNGDYEKKCSVDLIEIVAHKEKGGN